MHKTFFTYYFCEKYGEQDTKYLDIHNYTLTKRNLSSVTRLVNSMKKAIALPSRYTYIAHHATTYGNVPLWVAMNAFTYGQVSKMYQYITNDVQYKISQKFDNVSERELHQFLSVLARCRNVCAHGEILIKNILKQCPHLTEEQLLNNMGFPANWDKISRYRKI